MADHKIEIVRHIAAPPAVVYRHLTDESKWILWQGTSASLDPRPGGGFDVTMDNGMRARGEYIELVRNRRVVFTWGWEGHPSVPPGSSRVEIDLRSSGEGTVLTLRHTGLPDDEIPPHTTGWEQHLPRLAARARSDGKNT